MEWLCWISRLFFILSFLFATSHGDYLTGAMHAIRCMLAQTAPRDCHALPEVKVPSYLIQEYNDSPSHIHDALRSGQLVKLSNDQVASLPLSLLYLIPRGRLAELNGTQLGAIIHKHPDDTSLAHQVVASLQHRRQLQQLILKVSSLTQDVLQIVGNTISVSDLRDNGFCKSFGIIKEPILAYLRPSVLFKLDVNITYKVLFLFKDFELPKLPRKQMIHTITQAAIRNEFPLTRINWLVLGLTPDELKNDSLEMNLNTWNFKLDFTSMQARAVFERVYHNVTLTQPDFIDCKTLLFKLSPTQLLRFPYRDLHFDTTTLSMPPMTMSLPTACQITEYVKADCQLTGKLPKGDDKWGTRIRYMGQWVYTLPLDALQEYLEAPLNTASLQILQSPALSKIQAYYLTGKGDALDVHARNSVEGLDSLLHALPASQLMGVKVGDISIGVLYHLVANLPAENLPRTLSLVLKIASTIGESQILENLLDNRDVNAIMSLVSPKDLQESGGRILQMFADNPGYASVVRQLPQPILAALLEQSQQSDKWTWQSLLDKSQVNQLLIGGLSCRHIEDMDTGLFVPIMAEYNRQRQQAFPKNLQLCCLRKLLSYLQLKMTLSQTDPRNGLMAILEPVEIESVGGYVLVGLPVEAIKESPYLGHILTAIGKLSSAELILAANITHLQALAQLAVDKEGNIDVFVAGNLSWFLPPNANIPELKLMLESGLLDTTLCLPSESRRFLAGNLLADFGPAEGWSAGVLATLQDLLMVFTSDELHNISRAAWTEAADCLTSHYADDVNWIKPTPFYQICANVLGKTEEMEYKSAVTTLVRWQLRAAQWQLDTVQQLSRVSPSTHHYHNINDLNIEHHSQTTEGVFNPDFIDDEEESTSTTQSSTTENDITATSPSQEDTSSSTSEGWEESTTATSGESTTVTSTESTKESIDDKKISTSESSSTEGKMTSITEERESVTSAMEESLTTEINNNTEDINDKKIFTTKEFLVTERTTPISQVSSTEQSKSITTENNSTTSTGKIPFPTITKNTTVESTTLKINSDSSSDSTNTEESTSIILHNHNTTQLTPISEMTNSSSNFSHSVNKSTSIPSSNVDSLNRSTTEQSINVSTPASEFNKSDITGNATHLSGDKGEVYGKKDENNTDIYDVDSTGDSIIDEDYDDDQNSKSISIIDPSGGSITDDGIKVDDTKLREKRNSVQSVYTTELTCNALKMVGKKAAMVLTERDLAEMSDTELNSCRVELGAMKLNVDIIKKIWKRINKQDGTHLLGNLLKAATVADLWDLEFHISSPWLLETIHAYIKHTNNSVVIEKLLKEVQSSNVDFPPELLVTLGGSVCSLEPDNLKSLSVVALEPWTHCPVCLSGLARKAVEELGPVSQWSQHHVHTLHGIVAGLELEDWKILSASPHKPLSALQPSAVMCLNTSHLQSLTPDQIQLIPPLTLHTLSQQQVAALNETQLWALGNATHLSIPEKMTSPKVILVAGVPSTGTSNVAAVQFVLLTSLLYVMNFL